MPENTRNGPPPTRDNNRPASTNTNPARPAYPATGPRPAGPGNGNGNGRPAYPNGGAPRPAGPGNGTSRPAGGPGGNGGRPAGAPGGGGFGGGRPAGAPGSGGRPGGSTGGRPGGAPGGGGFGGGRPGGGPGGRPGGGAGGRPGGAPGGGFGSGGGRPSGGRGRGRGGASRGAPGSPRAAAATKTRVTGPITLPSTMLVKDLAEMLDVSSNEIIMKLIATGVFANVNQVIDYKVSSLVATEFGFEPTEAAPVAAVSAAKTEMISQPVKGADVQRSLRPPVVTVMGHVDHGKTSLLDAIRKTKVAAGEAGGITQHIGAYQVETTDGRPVTFLDTPGHEAFTAMRARGARVTDVAVIVVAADDGVMPQTIEAIDHARAAQVPILVALNKIDKENANPDFVKNQLAEHNVIIEEYGGDVVLAPVSAKKGIGIEELLELILLVADVQDLSANAKGHGVGTVLEARIDKNSGIVANLLVQDGTLKIGDIIVVGTRSGKIRAMFDDTGARIKTAGPSTPVSVLALSEVPDAGDQFTMVADERAARALIEQHRQEAERANAVVTLDTLYTQMQQGKVKELNLLLKADVQGSMDALHQVLSKSGTDQLKVRLIHEAVGNISEADVHLASASKAIIIGFNVRPDGAAQRLAQNEHVDIRFYDVIYKLVDDIDAALKGMLEPVYKEVVEGHGEILQTFKSGKTIIGGCRVTDGKLTRSAMARVLRGGKEIYSGTISSLKRGKDDAREVATGFECGLTMEDFNDLQIGDIIETSVKVRV